MSETLRWKSEELVTDLTDTEAAVACERVPADNQSASFARSLVADFRRYGSLWPNKRFWLHSIALGQIERENGTSESSAGSAGSLPRIAAFLTPVSKHLKSGARVTFTSGTLTVTIKRSSLTSRNPGSFYVNGLTGFGESGAGSIYAGRIAPDGGWFPTSACETSVMALLDEFENDPVGYAMAYGQRSGRCCFCDIPLSDPVSIGMGYGPVCARHYALPHGKRAMAKMVAKREAAKAEHVGEEVNDGSSVATEVQAPL
jgi:hypothetical protein